jgi:hypothetical protein
VREPTRPPHLDNSTGFADQKPPDPAAIGVDRELLAASESQSVNRRSDEADLEFVGIHKNAPQRGLHDQRWRGSLRRKRRDRRMMQTSSNIM